MINQFEYKVGYYVNSLYIMKLQSNQQLTRDDVVLRINDQTISSGSFSTIDLKEDWEESLCYQNYRVFEGKHEI